MRGSKKNWGELCENSERWICCCSSGLMQPKFHLTCLCVLRLSQFPSPSLPCLHWSLDCAAAWRASTRSWKACSSARHHILSPGWLPLACLFFFYWFLKSMHVNNAVVSCPSAPWGSRRPPGSGPSAELQQWFPERRRHHTLVLVLHLPLALLLPQPHLHFPTKRWRHSSGPAPRSVGGHRVLVRGCCIYQLNKFGKVLERQTCVEFFFFFPIQHKK